MSIKYLINFFKENFYFLNNLLTQSKSKKLRKLQIPKNIVFKFITKLEPDRNTQVEEMATKIPKVAGYSAMTRI